MAQMTKCPRCGADNSVRRETCYVCQEPLRPPQEAQPERDSSAADRFAAVAKEQPPQRRQPQAEVLASSESGLPTSYATIWAVGRARSLFRRLHAEVNAGIPLVEALMALRSRVDATSRPAVRAMAEHVAAGGRLSEILGDYPHLFLAHHAGLLRASETAGTLPQALDEIASDCEMEYDLRRSVGVALIPFYLLVPVILAMMPLALMLRGEPPGGEWTALTLLRQYSITARNISLPIGLGIVALWVFWIAGARSPSVAALQHRISSWAPLVRGMSRRMGITRFLGSLSVLLNAGVPIGEAYRVSAAATGNRALTAGLLAEADNLYAGLGLSETVARVGLLSGESVDRIAVGETAGTLPQALGEIEADYRRASERALRFFPRLMQIVAYALFVPVVGLLIYAFASVYLRYTMSAGMRLLDEIP